MKIKDDKGEFKHITKVGTWKQKFFDDNGTTEDQIIEQAMSPTAYKNKIKDWISNNPKPGGG